MGVYITGKSLYCSLGTTVQSVVSGMHNMDVKPGAASVNITGASYERPYYLIPGSTTDAGEAESFFYKVLYDAVEKALDDAGLGAEAIANAGIFVGSTSIDISIYEAQYQDNTKSGILSQKAPGYGYIAEKIAQRFGLKGPCYTFTTACTSSANGIMYASAMIESGKLEHAVVVGYDFFNNLGLYGFESLKLLSTDYCRPFDKNRNGIILGEACGVVVLSGTKKSARDFKVINGGNICDAHNVSTHDPEGSVIARLIRNVLESAQVNIDEINAVKSHGTASENNDRAEGNGMRKVFAGEMPPVICLKPYVGHTVGACGVVEIILFTEAVKSGFVPATPYFSEYDEETGVTPLTRELEISQGLFLMNYFGFGGNCTCLLVDNRGD